MRNPVKEWFEDNAIYILLSIAIMVAVSVIASLFIKEKVDCPPCHSAVECIMEHPKPLKLTPEEQKLKQWVDKREAKRDPK